MVKEKLTKEDRKRGNTFIKDKLQVCMMTPASVIKLYSATGHSYKDNQC